MFRSRRLDHIAMPYVYLDATYIKARHQHRIVSRAVVSLPPSPPTGTAKFSVSMLATPKTRCSGPRSSAH